MEKPPRKTECPSCQAAQPSGPEDFGSCQATPAVGEGSVLANSRCIARGEGERRYRSARRPGLE